MGRLILFVLVAFSLFAGNCFAAETVRQVTVCVKYSDGSLAIEDGTVIKAADLKWQACNEDELILAVATKVIDKYVDAQLRKESPRQGQTILSEGEFEPTCLVGQMLVGGVCQCPPGMQVIKGNCSFLDDDALAR